MEIGWILAASLCGGLLAGVVGLLVGGVGVWRVQMAQWEVIEGLHRRLESEVKARAGAQGGRPAHLDPLAAAVALRAATPEPREATRAEIMRRAGA